MRRKIFFVFAFILIILTDIKPVPAANLLELNIVQTSQLSERKSIWPDWYVPSLLKRPGFKDD